MRNDPCPGTPPSWIFPWAAALPLFYPISLLAVLGIRALRVLPRSAQVLLAWYFCSQIVPAIFTPSPLVAIGLTVFRSLLMFGLIGLGVQLYKMQNMRWVLIGLVGVILTAFVYSTLNGGNIFTTRLAHPYMTPVTIGLAGCLTVWLASFSSGRWLWRVPLVGLGTAALLLSGSRGSLFALIVGVVFGIAIQSPRKVILIVLAIALPLIGGVLIVGTKDVAAIARLTRTDSAGRDTVWENSGSVIQAFPLAGVGSYRLGKALTANPADCQLFPTATGDSGSPCPAWLRALGNPWVIAHNITYQQLAETGPLGLLGLFSLVSVVLLTAWLRQDALGVAILAGLCVSTVNDNTLLLPSPFFAEVFWLTAGVQLLHLRTLPSWAGWAAMALAFVLSGPVLLALRPTEPIPVNVNWLYAPRNASNETYTVLVQYALPAGSYRAALSSCTQGCAAIAEQAFKVGDLGLTTLNLTGNLRPTEWQQLRLTLYSERFSFRFAPILGVTAWNVQLRP